MHLDNLSIVNFKNYRQVNMRFSPNVNCFVGHNGAGKTNLLDAIHYLSFCKSYFNSFDNQNIFHDEDMFVIQGHFDKDGQQEEIYCAQKRNDRKLFKRNKKDYGRFSEHIGLLPVVMISPTDIELIHEGSEVRRRFVDSILSQIDSVYLNNLIEYNKALLQRNAMLKRFFETRSWDDTLMAIWDEQLIEKGKQIFNKRKEFTEAFTGIFEKVYSEISGSREVAKLEYSSQLSDGEYADIFSMAIDKDRIVQYTTTGVHKDEWLFLKDGYPLKKFASQGQQKSFIIALKIAQFHFLKKHFNFPPIVLLDDIFDKLDENRVSYLINMVTGNDFHQVFITDTSHTRMKNLLEKKGKDYKIFPINEGALDEVTESNLVEQ
ncbi:MAG TPA: DNA replication/repair protein RecF [Bacteroidia bacterium]|nr:DNA replication/repair protein RecF [Bacteroidia bacterium]